MSIDLDGGKAFEMSTVIGRYNDYMNEQQMSLDSYIQLGDSNFD